MPPEEDLMRMLKFEPQRKIREFINNNPSMDLHYPTRKLTTPLTTAIERSDPAILAMLIDKVPANLDASLTQPCGRTGLMHAARCAKSPEILQVLIRKGADPVKTDLRGWNCLFYAVIGKRLENVDALLESEVPIESRDREGRTPLMISVYLSSFQVFKHLIERGANTDARDNNGLSVLQLAILWRKREYVMELMERNPDYDHRTPFAKATTRQILVELMADILPVKRSTYHDECENDDY